MLQAVWKTVVREQLAPRAFRTPLSGGRPGSVLGSDVRSFRFRVKGLGSGVQGLGFGVRGSGFGVWGLGCGV